MYVNVGQWTKLEHSESTSARIHDEFIKILGDESPSYSTVKKRAAEFKEEGRVLVLSLCTV